MSDLVSAYQVCCGEKPLSDDKWHRRFLEDAWMKASWSKDPSTKCGCVIVDDKQRIISCGYNGFPRGIKDTVERLNNRDLKYDLTIHAEMNAILFAKVPLDGCTLYVVPMPPCIRCAVMVIQAGITRVVSISLTHDIAKRWGASIEKSKALFREAGVEYIEINM